MGTGGRLLPRRLWVESRYHVSAQLNSTDTSMAIEWLAIGGLMYMYIAGIQTTPK